MTKEEFAQANGIAVELVEWCIVCEMWDFPDANGWQQCPCV